PARYKSCSATRGVFGRRSLFDVLDRSLVATLRLGMLSCITTVNGDLCGLTSAIRRTARFKHLGGAGKYWGVFDFYDHRRALTGAFWDKSGQRKIAMTNADEAQIFTVFDEAMLRTGSRADFVFDTLRDAIWDGRIGRGVRLREEEIARNMGVSR